MSDPKRFSPTGSHPYWFPPGYDPEGLEYLRGEVPAHKSELPETSVDVWCRICVEGSLRVLIESRKPGKKG